MNLSDLFNPKNKNLRKIKESKTGIEYLFDYLNKIKERSAIRSKIKKGENELTHLEKMEYDLTISGLQNSGEYSQDKIDKIKLKILIMILDDRKNRLGENFGKVFGSGNLDNK